VLTVQIDDTQNGSQAIVAGEASLDKPMWAGGTPVSLVPVDGAFDSPVETAVATLDATGLGSGRHTVFVRGQDEAGYWGPLTSLFFSTPLIEVPRESIYLPILLSAGR
jgi:hypothetical protein